jgi:hypothetical protein
VKFLTKKSDSLRTLREFLLVDVQAEGMMVENLQADGAPELISAAAVELVAKQGGKLSYSPPYTPEINGIAERSNQTIYNAGYAMLLSGQPPRELLGTSNQLCCHYIYTIFFRQTPSQGGSSHLRAGLVGQGVSLAFESGGALPTSMYRLIFGTLRWLPRPTVATLWDLIGPC